MHPAFQQHSIDKVYQNTTWSLIFLHEVSRQMFELQNLRQQVWYLLLKQINKFILKIQWNLSNLIQHTKRQGNCVGLYRMSVLFQLTEMLWDYKFLSDVTGCRKTQVSDLQIVVKHTQISHQTLQTHQSNSSLKCL